MEKHTISSGHKKKEILSRLLVTIQHSLHFVQINKIKSGCVVIATLVFLYSSFLGLEISYADYRNPCF